MDQAHVGAARRLVDPAEQLGEPGHDVALVDRLGRRARMAERADLRPLPAHPLPLHLDHDDELGGTSSVAEHHDEVRRVVRRDRLGEPRLLHVRRRS
jgi:hypothetical protein